MGETLHLHTSNLKSHKQLFMLLIPSLVFVVFLGLLYLISKQIINIDNSTIKIESAILGDETNNP